MMTEKVFLIFSVLYLIVMVGESVLLFLFHRKQKALADQIEGTQKSYETRMRFHMIKLEDAIKEREEKIRELEQQIELLQNDEEKRLLRDKITQLEREVQTLQTELAVVKNRMEQGKEIAEIDPMEELFQIKTRNMELEMQLSELQWKFQEYEILREKLTMDQQRVQELQQALTAAREEVAKLHEEHDILRVQRDSFNASSFAQ
jgi:peptidoglycan hydrolase CwlO-like protein